MNLRLVDLPGTYSLTSYTMEEQVSRQFVMGDEVDMIITWWMLPLWSAACI